jgi:hypothetical protein
MMRDPTVFSKEAIEAMELMDRSKEMSDDEFFENMEKTSKVLGKEFDRLPTRIETNLGLKPNGALPVFKEKPE